MDNHLTPNKIQKMLFFAQEDKSFSARKRLPLTDDGTKCMDMQRMEKPSMQFESSSGILDLEKVEGFGESGVGMMSLSKSTTFNPGEMTGRSTGTDDIKSTTVNIDMGKAENMLGEYGRHSFALESLASNLEKQTQEVNDIIRHSIATNYSFHSKRDLSADEASFVVRQAPLPIQQSSHVNITTENTLESNTNMSMGSYFKNRCPEFTNMLGKSDSPSRSLRPSINEVFMSVPTKSSEIDANSSYKMDQSLDCIPVRQSKNTENSKVPLKESTYNINHTNLQYSYAVPEISVSTCKTEVIPKITKLEAYKNEHQQQVQEDKRKIEQNLLQKMFIQTLSAEQFLKKAHPSPFQIPTEESGASIDNENTENSLSISKIADYLGKQSNVSVSGMLQLNNQRKQINKKQPLTELHMNLQNKKIDEEISVTKLKDAIKMDTASSASTMNTVISFERLNINHNTEKREVPEVVVTRHSLNKNDSHDVENKSRTIRSKSPSSKSQSTLSTVQENYLSFKSSNSPLQSSKGEANLTYTPSPNVEYKELDKSVDWQEILQHKHFEQEGLAKEQWAEIHASVVNGFVGTSNAATITITTLSDSWLTAKIHFDDLTNIGRDLTIELPRQPVLLSPGKTEQFPIYIMSNVEMNTTLPFTVHLKDASVDGELEQIGELQVDFKMPTIQTLSCDGMNKLTFPPVHENTSMTRYFVILSDCPVDLQLDLSIVEGDMFTIKSVQEIRKNEVSKALMERHGSEDEHTKVGKSKGKILNKQLCRLTSGNAIRVSIVFTAPKITKSDPKEKSVTFNGTLKVNLMGVKAVLKTMDLIGVIASANLEVEIPMQKLQINANERKSIVLRNTGSITGNWIIRIQDKITYDPNVPFQISSHRVEIHPGGEKQLNILYTGTQDVACEATLVMEDANTGDKKSIDICGGSDKPRLFPIKTNYSTMSWVRVGRKELSLRNSTDKKIKIRCQIVGEGFSIDLPRAESRGIYSLSFGPNDCRPLPIVFSPMSTAPHAAALYLVYDKNSEFSRKVKLFGCASGESVRWNGLVTYGDTALLRATAREPVNLTLFNKYNVPAFVSARVNFNLQYRCCVASSHLAGGKHIVGARGKHSVVLQVDWARLERRAREVNASALADVAVLTGPELTRRRILRIIRNKNTGELDTSLLPDHLKVLAQDFEGQDVVSNECLKDFEETTASLNDLIESLQELKAHIALPQDFADENTIIITDETVLEYHTLLGD